MTQKQLLRRDIIKICKKECLRYKLSSITHQCYFKAVVLLLNSCKKRMQMTTPLM